MKRIILVGSPRSEGRSAHLAEMLFEAHIDERPEDELFLVPVSEIEVGPCVGCGACRELSPVTFKADDGAEFTELRPRCVFDDDMQTLYDLLDEADELTVVSPIYFSGAPASLKCVLDRMQPYFWADARKAPKRPSTLHVVGEGGDPHGHDALLSEVKSALAVAGFRLRSEFDWVGKVTPAGDIVAEADERPVIWGAPAEDNPGTADLRANAAAEGAEGAADAMSLAAGEPGSAGAGDRATGNGGAGASSARSARRSSAKLDLYGTGKRGASAAQGGKRSGSSGRGQGQKQSGAKGQTAPSGKGHSQNRKGKPTSGTAHDSKPASGTRKKGGRNGGR